MTSPADVWQDVNAGPLLRARMAAGKTLRRVVPTDTLVGRGLEAYRHRTTTLHGKHHRQWQGDDFLVVESRTDPEPRRGIALFGGCDIPAFFALHEKISARPRGTVVMQGVPDIGCTRPDILLSSLELDRSDPELERVLEVVRQRLHLRDDYFEPNIFEERVVARSMRHTWDAPVSAVVFSPSGAIRSGLQHRTHGFVVDPGSLWINDKQAGKNRQLLAWLQEEFQKLPKPTVDEFVDGTARLVDTVHARNGAHVVIMNLLTVEPGLRTHRLKSRRKPESYKRRQLALGLADVVASRPFCHLLDLDEVLKFHGVREQYDFAHFPIDSFSDVADAGYDLLVEAGVL